MITLQAGDMCKSNTTDIFTEATGSQPSGVTAFSPYLVGQRA